MEETVGRTRLHFRDKKTIVALLEDWRSSGMSIKSFCASHHIATATFHNWKKKYLPISSVKTKQSTGFSAVQLVTPVQSSPSLFAEVNGIRLYQPVAASYLKELLS